MLRKIEVLAMGLGGPGLFILAFLDSSFLALPEVVDILIVWSIIEHPERWLWYGAMATAGSVAGCYVLYALARRGGETFLRRRVKADHITRGMYWFRRYGVLALVVPSLTPPPVPFKPFVLMAGVSSMPPARFLAAITTGRGVRYIGEAVLALLYGRQALTFVHTHARPLSVALGVLIIAGLLGHYAYRKLQARQ